MTRLLRSVLDNLGPEDKLVGKVLGDHGQGHADKLYVAESVEGVLLSGALRGF